MSQRNMKVQVVERIVSIS